MRKVRDFAAEALVLGVALGACAQLSGLNEFAAGDRSADGSVVDPADGDAQPTEGDAASREAGADGCGATCPGSAAGTCPVGGCNAPSGACISAGQPCSCIRDSDCKSGKCVKTSGRNELSCGGGCTGTGAADGLGCALAAPGIPAACAAPSFVYTPSNFVPASYTPPATATTIDCNTTYNSTTHAFTGWCAGQTAPAIYSNFPQSGGPSVDILAFRALTLDAANTLTLTGDNPIIIAVYGAADLSGVIDASAQGSTPGPGATACAAGAGGGGVPGPSSPAGTDPGAAGGGGGGLAAGGGAGDFSTYSGVGGNPATGTDNIGASGGSAHGSSAVVPLTGGCSGGAGADGSPGNAGGGGGAGGGGVQLSVAGTISGSGTIKTNGSAGGTGASASPALAHTSGAGGGGGGSGGAILIESPSTSSLTLQTSGGPGGGGGTGYGADTTSTNTWSGIPGGAGGTNSGVSTGAPGSGGPPGERGQSYSGGGGGGGGAYGRTKINTGAAPVYACTTTLSPAPVCNAAHSSCLCVADSDCSSGKCVNASTECTGTCTGAGSADGADCQLIVSVAVGR